jgi:hypothetical protein
VSQNARVLMVFEGLFSARYISGINCKNRQFQPLITQIITDLATKRHPFSFGELRRANSTDFAEDAIVYKYMRIYLWSDPTVEVF